MLNAKGDLDASTKSQCRMERRPAVRDGDRFDGEWNRSRGGIPFRRASRVVRGTNPEELMAAAHAACFSMALSNGLANGGHTPDSVRTEARVHLEKGEAGFSITRIDLVCVARVPGIDEDGFQKQAQAAKTGCPVSGALAAVDIDLNARLA